MASNISNHYEVPNMASMLYEFTNRESDHIHQAFRVGNFVSLRDLPNVILPGNVSIGQTSKMEENLYSVIERKTYVELSNNGGYFSKFEWKPEPYGNFTQKLKKARLDHISKVEAVGGGAPFLTVAKISPPHRHESMFRSLLF